MWYDYGRTIFENQWVSSFSIVMLHSDSWDKAWNWSHDLLMWYVDICEHGSCFTQGVFMTFIDSSTWSTLTVRENAWTQNWFQPLLAPTSLLYLQTRSTERSGDEWFGCCVSIYPYFHGHPTYLRCCLAHTEADSLNMLSKRVYSTVMLIWET